MASRAAAAPERLEIVRAVQLLYELDEREIAIPIFADMGENGDPDALVGLGELTVALQRRPRHAAARQGRAQSRPAVRPLRLSRQRHPVVQADRARRSSRASSTPIARQESAFNPAVVSPAQAYGLMQVTPDAGRYVCKRAGVGFDLSRMKTDSGLQRRARRRRARRAARGLSRLLHPDLRRPTMPAAAASRNGSSATAIRAIPRSTRSTGSNRSRSPRRATTCSGSWRTCRSIARGSAAAPGSRSKPTCIAAPASNSEYWPLTGHER